jgi:integrase/recombinase XerD
MDVYDATQRYLLQLSCNGRTVHTKQQATRHIAVLARWMERELHTADLARLGFDEIARFLTSDDATKRPDGTPKKATSVNAIRSTVRAFFAHCAAAGITPGNPAALVRRAIVSDPVPRALSTKEVDALRAALAQAESPSERRDRVLFELLLRTGLRIGSALGLEIGDVDLDERRIWIRVAKRGRQQVVGFDAELGALLAELIGVRATGLLFETEAGAPMTPRTAQRRLQGWVRKAGIARAVSQHQLRHTCAVAMLRESHDIVAVARQLGHASISTTHRYVRYVDAPAGPARV